ncbi:MAG: hypothetical protein ACE5GM_09625, partial [bacterium]
ITFLAFCSYMQEPNRTLLDIPSFSRHLHDFCGENRGKILKKFGKKRRYKYRFVNPLMQPHIIMQGLAQGLLDKKSLEKQ